MKWSSFLGAVALLLASLGSASATSIFEDVLISYSSSNPFTVSNLTFYSLGDPGLNIFGGSKYATSAGVSAGSGSLLNQVVSLDTSQTYGFSFVASYTSPKSGAFISGGFLQPSESIQTFKSSSDFSSPTFSYAVQTAVSPVPLPASLPLFILALISLAAFGYHTRRKTIRFAR
jgi:hypothetical protein